MMATKRPTSPFHSAESNCQGMGVQRGVLWIQLDMAACAAMSERERWTLE